MAPDQKIVAAVLLLMCVVGVVLLAWIVPAHRRDVEAFRREHGLPTRPRRKRNPRAR